MTDDIERLEVDLTVTVLMCADCARDRMPNAMQALALRHAVEPCEDGGGEYTIHCQVCRKLIGAGTTAGTIDLS